MTRLQLSDHVVQNRQTDEQMTHWAMLNKENSNLVVLFKDFVPRDRSAAKSPFQRL